LGSPLANGILGVVWFIVNAVFALVLLILVLISCAYALFSKDPNHDISPCETTERVSSVKRKNQAPNSTPWLPTSKAMRK
jgi:hypothetical protein